MKTKPSNETKLIRRQALLALAANRAPGFHYPGHLLGLHWPRVGDNDLEEVMPDGPQARNVDGSVNLAAFCVQLDTALANASRLKIERGARQATVHLHAQFTGAPLRGELRAHTRMGGYTTGAAARQSMTSGTVYAGGVPVCHASGTFIVLPPPPGVNLAPLPWQRESGELAPPLESKDLEPDERVVLRASNSALRRADDQQHSDDLHHAFPLLLSEVYRTTNCGRNSSSLIPPPSSL